MTGQFVSLRNDVFVQNISTTIYHQLTISNLILLGDGVSTNSSLFIAHGLDTEFFANVLRAHDSVTEQRTKIGQFEKNDQQSRLERWSFSDLNK